MCPGLSVSQPQRNRLTPKKCLPSQFEVSRRILYEYDTEIIKRMTDWLTDWFNFVQLHNHCNRIYVRSVTK